MAVKVRVPMMVQDPDIAPGMRAIEEFDIKLEDFFLDGPVTRQVAILDFDPVSGELTAGVPYLSPLKEGQLGRYKLKRTREGYDLDDLDFFKVSVFATVLRTMYLFQEQDALGRPLKWAFPGNQLLVIPRAGMWANAYYERASQSLQFFFFDGNRKPGEKIYTCLSRDIIAHETAHAILDGIAPDLYNAVTPQALALHEAVADMTALLMAFRSHNLRQSVLEKTAGSIKDSTAFSSVAEQFGRARDPGGRSIALRNLLNRKTLDPDDISRDENGRPNRVSRQEPHLLSEVLSGALYTVMVKIHESLKKKYAASSGQSEYSVSGRALANGANQFKRMIFRALDYLPPGEISFADYARAIIAADRAAYPDHSEARDWIGEEFAKRKIIPSRKELRVRTNFEYAPLQKIDLQALVDSDWVAYQFAEKNRRFLKIPPKVSFYVRPRLDVTKVYYRPDGPHESRECLFKVSWQHEEPNPDSFRSRFPTQRQIVLGTTLAIDWDTKMVRALLSTAPGGDESEADQQLKLDRDEWLQKLAGEGLLQIGAGGGASPTGIQVVVTDGVMRVRGTAQMLHIIS